MRWIVSLKPADPRSEGPHLVSDHPAVVRAVIDAIGSQYGSPAERTPSKVLRLQTDPAANAAPAP